MSIRIDWQLLDRDGLFTHFDLFPLGVSFMKFNGFKFFYIWVLFWVIDITWSNE